jgi:hypothetical protein
VRPAVLARDFRVALPSTRPDQASDLVGFRSTQPVVKPDRFLEMELGLIGWAGGLVCASQAVVRTGLLVKAARLLGQITREGMLEQSFFRLPGGDEHFAKAIERFRLTGRIVALPEQGNGQMMVISGLLVAAQTLLDDAEPGQRLGLTDRVADLAAQGKSLLDVTESPLITSKAPLHTAEPGQGQGLTPAVAVLAGQRQRLALMDSGLLIVPSPAVDDGEVTQRGRFTDLVADLTEKGHGLPQVAGGLTVAALHQKNVAEIA